MAARALMTLFDLRHKHAWAVLLWSVMSLLIAGCRQVPAQAPASLDLTIAGEPFKMELALDEASRIQGLSDRKHIEPDGGMLFVFDGPRPLAFVMRRCYVPIDVVFLGPNARVVAVHAMQVEPDPHAPDHRLKRYDSGYPAQFALELAGGTAERLAIRPGQRIDLPLEDLKRWAR